jgi:hypothetical protein
MTIAEYTDNLAKRIKSYYGDSLKEKTRKERIEIAYNLMIIDRSV